jgi:sporulation protein YlmC with PRC-barrel domain
MQKINDLFGKRVVDLTTGDPVATVGDVVLSADGHRIVALIAGGGAFSSGDEHVIRWDCVRSIGEYVIVESATPFATVGDDAEVAELRKQAHKITGKTVISTTGEQIGTVGDMIFNDRGDVVGYTIRQGGGLLGGANGMLPAQQVQAVGKDAIIVATAELMPLTDDVDDAHARAVGEPRAPVVDVPPDREPQPGIPPELREPPPRDRRNIE